MKIKILLGWLLAFMVIAGAWYCYAEQDDYDTVGWDPTNQRSIWRWNSSGHYIPAADDTYDIGTSALEVRNIYIDGTATIDTLTVDVASTFTGGITTDTLTATGNVTMNDAGADTILIGSATDTVRIYGIMTLGDNGATGEVNTSDWDISETGAMTGIGAITMNGLLTGTAGATITGAVVNLNASSNFATNINTGTTTAAVAIGGGSGTVAVNSSDWDINTTGDMTGIGALTMDGVFTQSLATANPFSVTSTLAGISTAVNIYNTNADVTGQQYLLDLKYTDDDDTDADFIRCIDDAGVNADLLFDVDSAGAITTASNIAVNGGTISSTVDMIIDSAGNDVDFDAADLQLDAGKKLSLNGTTETDYIYSSTDVEVGAAADIVLTPTGGQVDVNGADIGVDAGKYASLAGISALTQASLIYQNSAIEAFVNAVNIADFTATGLVIQDANVFTTGTGAVSLNGTTTVATGKTLNSVDNAGITLNTKIPAVSLLTAAQAIYSDSATLASGVLTVTFATAFSATPQVIASAKAAEYIYTTATSSTGATFASSSGTSTSAFDYAAFGAR